jgi:hypothetical protein
MTIRYRDDRGDVYEDDDLRHHLAAVHNWDTTQTPDRQPEQIHSYEHRHPHTSAGDPHEHV